MLVLTRRLDEDVWITTPDGTRVVVKVVPVRGDRVRLGFDADQSVVIDRSEVGQEKQRDAARGGGR